MTVDTEQSIKKHLGEYIDESWPIESIPILSVDNFWFLTWQPLLPPFLLTEPQFGLGTGRSWASWLLSQLQSDEWWSFQYRHGTFTALARDWFSSMNVHILGQWDVRQVWGLRGFWEKVSFLGKRKDHEKCLFLPLDEILGVQNILSRSSYPEAMQSAV